MLAELGGEQWAFLLIAAAIVGFTKTSVGGMGILAVLLMALAFPGKTSPGVLLPMLIAADIMAVIYFRRDCQWHIILRLLPLTVAGVVVGYFIVKLVPADLFEKTLGMIILAMLCFNLILDGRNPGISENRMYAGVVGALAGASSMVANAAGPVFGVYLLQMGLKKEEFVGTRSWFFLVMNVVKLPFSVHLGLITGSSLTLNAVCLPVILAGGFLGIMVLKMINLTLFKWLIRVAIVVAAVRLIAF